MISAQPPSAVAADLACVAGRDRALPGEATAYRKALSPWCIVRLLPDMQRLTVARFRRRNDADAHARVLRRLIPHGTYVILFEAAVL